MLQEKQNEKLRHSKRVLFTLNSAHHHQSVSKECECELCENYLSVVFCVAVSEQLSTTLTDANNIEL